MTMNNETMSNTSIEIEHYYMPTREQQNVLSWLPIGPSILSLIGSYLIIYNIRNNSKASPYRRIMLALSVCNIVSTIGWILEPFLVPFNVDHPWAYAVGNEASCILLGAITQFGITQHLFLGFLSVYFLLTVKFAIKQRDFERNYEKWFHWAIFAFAIGSAVAGVCVGYFRPNVLAPGCWSNPPEEQDCGGHCPEAWFAFWMGAVPFLASLGVIIVSNILLFIHVRSTVVKAQKQIMSNELRLRDFQLQAPKPEFDESETHREDELDDSENAVLDELPAIQHVSGNESKLETIFSNSKGTVLSSASKQWKRVRQVGHQAFLYVGAYLVTFSWTFCVHYLNTLNFEHEPNSGKVLFPLLVLQAICGGSLGFIMSLIYFVPKIKQTRVRYEYEPWWWIVQMAITGDAEKVDRFSGISNVSSVKSDARSVASGNSKNNKVPQITKKISWKAEAPPHIPTAIRLDHSGALNTLTDSGNALDVMEEEENMETSGTDPDLDHSSSDIKLSKCSDIDLEDQSVGR